LGPKIVFKGFFRVKKGVNYLIIKKILRPDPVILPESAIPDHGPRNSEEKWRLS
jgi:hypothetical protein